MKKTIAGQETARVRSSVGVKKFQLTNAQLKLGQVAMQ